MKFKILTVILALAVFAACQSDTNEEREYLYHLAVKYINGELAAPDKAVFPEYSDVNGPAGSGLSLGIVIAEKFATVSGSYKLGADRNNFFVPFMRDSVGGLWRINESEAKIK